MSLNERKRKLRSELRSKLNNLSDRSEQSQKVLERLEPLLSELQPKTLGLFLPMHDEVDIEPLLQSVNSGKAIPRWMDNQLAEGQMEFFSFRSKEDLEEQQMFGKNILQIKETEKVIPDVLLVPGLAFTRSKERLGRGKGFYDRYIEKYKDITTIGICFREQLQENLPLGDHDRLLDILVTPDEVYR
jgi:5-formyltetrahydrofolate cyclo-ligase